MKNRPAPVFHPKWNKTQSLVASQVSHDSAVGTVIAQSAVMREPYRNRH